MTRSLLFIIIFGFLLSFPSGPVFAQTKDDQLKSSVQELTRDVIKAKRKPVRNWVLYSNLELSYGHESNVNFTPLRKGSTYEEEFYSLSYIKKLAPKVFLTVDYSVDSQNYNQITDANNILNHIRTSLNRSVGKTFVVGAGYDGSWEYLPNFRDGDYIFNRAFVYVRQKVSPRLFHQVTFEKGWKAYIKEKALGNVVGTFEDKRQFDDRESVEYAVGYTFTPRLFMKIRGRYSMNDSNAKYQDFYDYESWDIIPRAYYQLTKKLRLNTGFSYTRRNYKNRLITDQSEKQEDNIYGINAGLNYRLTRHNQVSLNYSYLQNISNDDLSQYIDRTTTVRWLYDF